MFVALGMILACVLLACVGLYFYVQFLNLRIRWRNWRKARKASRIRHITVGIDDVWEPSREELDNISALFMQAGNDQGAQPKSGRGSN